MPMSLANPSPELGSVALSSVPPLVLIADDDKLTRLMLAQTLERDGYRVIEACNGRECLEMFELTRPNIVLLDAMMPELNGFECCQQLLSLPNSEHVPVLMITGLEDRASVDWAFESGATDYVTKPINVAVLRRRVRLLIEKSQITQALDRANQELQRLAYIDGLTQVSNRRTFDEYLAQEWLHMERARSPLSLILCDVDHFKTYNDSHGHQAGDACLQQIAATLGQVVRQPTDLVARYGGEEFAIILPNADAERVVEIGHRIRTKVSEILVNPDEPAALKQAITLSVGVASVIPSAERTVEDLVSCADRALFQAKAAGRGRVVACHPDSNSAC